MRTSVPVVSSESELVRKPLRRPSCRRRPSKHLESTSHISMITRLHKKPTTAAPLSSYLPLAFAKLGTPAARPPAWKPHSRRRQRRPRSLQQLAQRSQPQDRLGAALLEAGRLVRAGAWRPNLDRLAEGATRRCWWATWACTGLQRVEVGVSESREILNAEKTHAEARPARCARPRRRDAPSSPARA